MGIFNNVGRYTDNGISEYIKNFNRQIQSGLKLYVNNNYDIQQKRLVNVGEGIDNDDAIIKHQMEVALSTKPNATDFGYSIRHLLRFYLNQVMI